MNGKKEASLYVHIPLCTKKCDYCHFYVIPNKPSFQQDLKEGLYLEWDRIKSKFNNFDLVSLYFGGGTPSLIEPSFFHDFINQIPVVNGAEITLEVNPETVTLEKMKLFKEAGINRISLGVQSLDNTELIQLSREHSSNFAIEAVHNVHKAGFENITIDLMYDTPGQTLASWERTLKKSVELPITHLSLYNLTIEPHTAFYKRRNTLKKSLPDEETSVAMYQMARSVLEDAGLHQYEISAFCKPGFQAIHNTGYWKGRSFLGIGPSAFSYWEGCRFQNAASLSKWKNALDAGKNGIDFHEKLGEKESLKERFVIALRMLEGVRKPQDQELLTVIEKLKDDGFLKEVNGLIQMTEKGILFYDHLAAELI